MNENPESAAERMPSRSEFLQKIDRRRRELDEGERLRDRLTASERELTELVNQRLTAAGSIDETHRMGNEVEWDMTFTDEAKEYQVAGEGFSFYLQKGELPKGGNIENVIRARIQAVGDVGMLESRLKQFRVADLGNGLELLGHDRYKDTQTGEETRIVTAFELPPADIVVARNQYGHALRVYEHFIDLIKPAQTPQPPVPPAPLSQG